MFDLVFALFAKTDSSRFPIPPHYRNGSCKMSEVPPPTAYLGNFCRSANQPSSEPLPPLSPFSSVRPTGTRGAGDLLPSAASRAPQAPALLRSDLTRASRPPPRGGIWISPALPVCITSCPPPHPRLLHAPPRPPAPPRATPRLLHASPRSWFLHASSRRRPPIHSGVDLRVRPRPSRSCSACPLSEPPGSPPAASARSARPRPPPPLDLARRLRSIQTPAGAQWPRLCAKGTGTAGDPPPLQRGIGLSPAAYCRCARGIRWSQSYAQHRIL
jgi:hypothetical protein